MQFLNVSAAQPLAHPDIIDDGTALGTSHMLQVANQHNSLPSINNGRAALGVSHACMTYKPESPLPEIDKGSSRL